MARRKVSLNQLSRQSSLPAFYQRFLATMSLRLTQLKVYYNVKDRQNWQEVTLATLNPALIPVLPLNSLITQHSCLSLFFTVTDLCG